MTQGVQAGKLDRLFTLEEPTEVIVAGNAKVVYIDRGRVWGSLEAESGEEGKLTADAIYKIGLRFRSDVTSRWRLGLVGSNPVRKFHVIAPPQDPDGCQRRLRVRATEIQA